MVSLDQSIKGCLDEHGWKCRRASAGGSRGMLRKESTWDVPTLTDPRWVGRCRTPTGGFIASGLVAAAISRAVLDTFPHLSEIRGRRNCRGVHKVSNDFGLCS